jgi:hypothetical protein
MCMKANSFATGTANSLSQFAANFKSPIDEFDQTLTAF